MVSACLTAALLAVAGPAPAVDHHEAPSPAAEAPKDQKTLPARCSQKPERGPCKALFWMFYFNPDTKTCEEFIYGGCDGSVPFESKEACEQECLPAKH